MGEGTRTPLLRRQVWPTGETGVPLTEATAQLLPWVSGSARAHQNHRHPSGCRLSPKADALQIFLGQVPAYDHGRDSVLSSTPKCPLTTIQTQSKYLFTYCLLVSFS